MPRGPAGGATAALIHALAEQGVQVSVYQIERWRADGELPRPKRRGLGRGRGVVSQPPDEATVQMAVVLARSSRRGARRFGVHPIERVALGKPVPERVVRRALGATLDRVASMTAADVVDGDAAWQARQDLIGRAVRGIEPLSWQDLVAAVEGKPGRPDPPRARRRAAVAGLVHAVGGGGEARPEDLVEMLGLFLDLPQEQVEEMLNAQRAAELRGEDPWSRVAEQMSVRNLRRVAGEASIERLERAITVISVVAAFQSLVVLLGALDLAGRRPDLGEHLDRFDGAMIRRLQADPMWLEANMHSLSTKPRQRVIKLVLSALALLAAGRLEAWEAYRDRLLQLSSA